MNEKEKQIEEMAWYMCDVPKHPSITSCEKCNCQGKCHPMYYAVRAYNAGYRKQRVGEWVSAYDYAVKIGVTDKDRLASTKEDKFWKFCSRCDQQVKGYHNFCPNCGARMNETDNNVGHK